MMFLARLLGQKLAQRTKATPVSGVASSSVDHDIIAEIHLDSVVGGLARSYVYEFPEEGTNELYSQL